MAIPREWAFMYSFNNNGSHFAGVTDARGICPHCGLATTFHVRNVQPDILASRATLYMILRCNSAFCQRTLYVQTSTLTAGTAKRSSPEDPFFVYPSRDIEPAHPSIPEAIADDWLEAQRSFAVSNPKSTAMMLRRVLYGVLLQKGCKLHPLRDGMQELIMRYRLPATFDDWLPAIKDDGHDAAHPDRALNVSTENVGETMEYTKELLRYLYIEPFEFQQRKARNATSTITSAAPSAIAAAP